MIKDYRETLLTDVMNKIGFADFFNKNTPVVIKQDFVVRESTLIKAGTIGYIKKAEAYDIDFDKGNAVCSLTLLTPKHRDISLFCKVFDKTDSVKVSGLKGDIELKELLETADEETGRVIERYYTLRGDYENISWRYYKKSEIASLLLFLFAVIMCVAGAIGWLCFANMVLGIVIISLAAIITVVGAILYNRGFNDTAKGKKLNSEIEALAEEISQMDEEHCKLFAN